MTREGKEPPAGGKPFQRREVGQARRTRRADVSPRGTVENHARSSAQALGGADVLVWEWSRPLLNGLF